MKKKILFMINSMGIGGAEKSLSSLLSIIDYDKYDVFLQLINRGGEFEKLLPPQVNILPDIPFFKFCKLSLLDKTNNFRLKYFFARVFAFIELRINSIRTHRLHPTQAFWKGTSFAYNTFFEEYDIAIAWGQGTPTHFVAEKVNAKSKLAWVNADYTAVGHNKEFDLHIYEKYDSIIGVSDNLSEKLKLVFPMYSERIHTVYDINSPNLISKMSNETAEFPKLHGCVLVTVGRLVSQKGYDIAIDAARILKNNNIDFSWMICGEGPERRILEDKIIEYGLKDSIFLLGSKFNPYPYIKRADIYVQTSRFEGYCLTLNEARILNIPCVTTRFDAVFDQMIDCVNGLVVDMTSQAVADGIIKLISDEELRKSIISFLKQENKGNEEEINKIYGLIDYGK